MRPSCRGICNFMAAKQQVRRTLKADYRKENWCRRCEIAYPDKSKQACDCCNGPLREKSPHNSWITIEIDAKQRRY